MSKYKFDFKFDLGKLIQTEELHYFNEAGDYYKARFLFKSITIPLGDHIGDRVQNVVNEVVDALNILEPVGFVSEPVSVYNVNNIDSITYMVVSIPLMPIGYKFPDSIAHLEQKEQEYD